MQCVFIRLSNMNFLNTILDKKDVMALDECFWELGRAFAFYKLENVLSFYINTNETGNRIEIGIFKLDQFSHEKVAYILECFNVFLKCFDNSQTWEDFTYTKFFITEVEDRINYYKNLFCTKTNSTLNLARQNIQHITKIHCFVKIPLFHRM